jgi:hypothetical protein
MPWKKGQSGNPLGRLPGEKQFADQLRIVLAEPVDRNDPQSVREIAPELTGHGLPLSKCEAYNRVYEQSYGSR